MDVYSRTFLLAASETGIAIPTVSRHSPVLRQCIGSDDTAVLVARCVRPDRPLRGEFLLALTQRRLVVTRETRFLRRLRLHLNTELRHLHNVSWNPDQRLSAVELAATAIDGVRERFWIRTAQPSQVWNLDAILSRVFRPHGAQEAAPARPTARPRLARGGVPAVALS